MTPAQRTALANPCLLAEETIYRSFASLLPGDEATALGVGERVGEDHQPATASRTGAVGTGRSSPEGRRHFRRRPTTVRSSR